MKYCKNTRGELHQSYSSYGSCDGYCFSCIHAGVPEMEAEIERGNKALKLLADIRSQFVNIGIPTPDLDAILGDWKP